MPNDPLEERKSQARMLYHYLSGAPLLLPLAEPAPSGGPVVMVESSPVNLGRAMVSVDPSSGQTALPAFIDSASLAQRFPGCRFMQINVEDLLKTFLAGRYDSLFLNPEKEWIALDRGSVEFLLAEGKPRS